MKNENLQQLRFLYRNFTNNNRIIVVIHGDDIVFNGGMEDFRPFADRTVFFFCEATKIQLRVGFFGTIVAPL
jgi:hypothetical protein